MDLGLKGRGALVCASTQGLGREIVLTLAEEGASVFVCGRRAEAVAAVVEEVRAAGGIAHGAAVDLTRRDEREALVRQAEDAFGRIDILVINGGGPPTGTIAELGLDAWEEAYRQQVESAVHLSGLALPGMVEAGWGRVLAITSFVTRQPADQLVLSNSLRAAVNGLIRSIANEYGPHGITANSVLPGFIRTERMERVAAGQAGQGGQTPEQRVAALERSIPLRRVGTPREFANVVTFLASEAASYLTGAAITVDGGMVRTVF